MRDTFNGKKDKIVASIPANPKENNMILKTDKSNVNPNSMTLKMNSEINIVIDKERKEKRINGTFFLFSPGLRKEKKHFFSAGFSSETFSAVVSAAFVSCSSFVSSTFFSSEIFSTVVSAASVACSSFISSTCVE